MTRRLNCRGIRKCIYEEKGLNYHTFVWYILDVTWVVILHKVLLNKFKKFVIKRASCRFFLSHDERQKEYLFFAVRKWSQHVILNRLLTNHTKLYFMTNNGPFTLSIYRDVCVYWIHVLSYFVNIRGWIHK